MLRETDAGPKPLLLQAAVPSVRPLKYDMLSDAEESAISGSAPSESFFLLLRLIVPQKTFSLEADLLAGDMDLLLCNSGETFDPPLALVRRKSRLRLSSPLFGE